MKAILKNLEDQIGEPFPRTIMYCPICGAESSANLADYFMIGDPDYEFQCCSKTMILAQKVNLVESL